jgi:hypothetical protein
VPLHEPLVNPPGNARDFYGVAFCTHRDLVGMEVMQAQFVEQRLFNNLMQIVRFEDFFSTFKPLSNSCARGTSGTKTSAGYSTRVPKSEITKVRQPGSLNCR